MDEISEAWDCTVKDVLQYWIEDKLHLCILIVPPKSGKRVTSPLGEGLGAGGDSEKCIESGDELSGAYYIDPYWEKEVNGELYKGRKFEFYSDITESLTIFCRKDIPTLSALLTPLFQYIYSIII